MLSLLNPASAPSAAGQAFAARGDNAADSGGAGGSEFAKALEQSNSSWQNQAAAESPARPTAPLQRGQGQGSNSAPPDATGSRTRTDAADTRRSDDTPSPDNTARSATGENAGDAGGEGTPSGMRPGRAGIRRNSAAETRQAGATQRQRSEANTARGSAEADEASNSKAIDTEDTQQTALDEDISLAAGLTPAPQASTPAPMETAAPGMPVLLQQPATDGQATAVPGDGATVTGSDAIGLPATDATAATQRGAATGISTTTLASSYRRSPLADTSSASNSQATPAAGTAAQPSVPPATRAAAGSTPLPTATTASGQQLPAQTTAETDPRSTAALAKTLAAADRDASAPRAGLGEATDQSRELRAGFIDRRAIRPLSAEVDESTATTSPTGPSAASTPAAPSTAVPTGASAASLTPDISQAASAAAQAQAATTAAANTAPNTSAGPADASAVAADAALPAARSLPASTAGRSASTAASQSLAGAADSRAGSTAALAAAAGRSDSGDRANSLATDGGNDKRGIRGAAPDSRRAGEGRSNRGDNDAAALAGHALAAPGARSQGDDSSGSRSDTQRDNSAAGIANAAAGNSSATGGSSAARFAEQLQNLMPAGATAVSAPQPAANTPATPVVTTQLSPSLYSPDFAPAMGAQVTLFARDGVHHARIELNPAEMGPISVQIEMKGSGARVDFQAEQAGTRQVIESSLPALASALRDAGMTLTGGGVFQPDVSQATAQNNSAFGNPAGGNQGGLDNGQAQGNGGQRGDSHGGRGGRGGSADDGGPLGATSTVRLAAAQRGLVDLIA